MRMLAHTSLVLFMLLTIVACTNLQNNETNFIENNWVIIWLMMLCLGSLIFLWWDKRNGYRMLAIGRTWLGEVVIWVRNMKNRKTEINQKLASEDNPITIKRSIQVFEPERSYIEADVSSIIRQEYHEPKSELVRSIEIEDDAPKVNLEKVFEQKESKSLNKHSKKVKSKSKIRNRLQGRTNEEGENQNIGQESIQQDNSLSQDHNATTQNSLQSSNTVV